MVASLRRSLYTGTTSGLTYNPVPMSPMTAADKCQPIGPRLERGLELTVQKISERFAAVLLHALDLLPHHGQRLGSRNVSSQHACMGDEAVGKQALKDGRELFGRRLVSVRVPVSCVVGELDSVHHVHIISQHLEGERGRAVAFQTVSNAREIQALLIWIATYRHSR